MPATSIGDALFTKTQQRVLALLYGRPDDSLYLNELTRLAQMGRGAVKRELTKLTDAGLITLKHLGNQNHYQANHNNPIFHELVQLVQKTFGIADQIKTALTSLSGQLEQAFIYGSVAKGEAHASSDVDLMLVGDDLSYGNIMEMLAQVETQIQRTINPTLYSPADFAKRVAEKQSFVTRVLEQPRIDLTFNGTE